MPSTPPDHTAPSPHSPTTGHPLSDAASRIEASIFRSQARESVESFPSIAQVLEEDLPSPAATQDRIDRIIAATDSSAPTAAAITSLPPRSETSAIETGAITVRQASSSSSPSNHHPAAAMPDPLPSPSPQPSPSIPSLTPTTTAPRLRALLASLSTSLRRHAPTISSSSSSSTNHPLATLTLSERITLTTHRQRIAAELGDAWLAPIVREWPKWKRNPLTCSAERLRELGFVAPAPTEVEAEARRGAEAARAKGRNTAKEERGDTRPELARLTVEAIQILDGLARFELVFRERAREWEEGVDPKTRTGTGTTGEESGGTQGGKRRRMGGLGREGRGGGEEGEGGEG